MRKSGRGIWEETGEREEAEEVKEETQNWRRRHVTRSPVGLGPVEGRMEAHYQVVEVQPACNAVYAPL